MQRIGIRLVEWLGLALLVCCIGSAWGADLKALRVCADPDNLPYSNEKSEGFENKIAELIARDMGVELSYTWWPHQRGLVRRTLNVGQCDVLIGIPKGYDLVLWTKPYYRTTYVIAYVKDRGPHLTSIDDPILRQTKIGVHVNTPPHDALAQRGIIGDNVIGYRLFYNPPVQVGESPSQLIEDLLAGKIDVALVWGPLAGYFAKKRSAPLELVPLRGDDAATPFAFDISMGVKKGEKTLKAELEEALGKEATAIRMILEEYGVPLLTAEATDTDPSREGAREGDMREGGPHRH